MTGIGIVVIVGILILIELYYSRNQQKFNVEIMKQLHNENMTETKNALDTYITKIKNICVNNLDELKNINILNNQIVKIMKNNQDNNIQYYMSESDTVSEFDSISKTVSTANIKHEKKDEIENTKSVVKQNDIIDAHSLAT